jgi:hypothetical protein
MKLTDFLSIAYDASTLAAIAPDAEGLYTTAEQKGLTARIIAELDDADFASLTSTISNDARAELDEAFASQSNVNDPVEGEGWDVVVRWVVDIVRPNTRGVDVSR